ncbi:MAG: riboflavin biosynthesis protein RibF [Clostridium sp.]|uniref:riboflavin biosynthesis protein RibF n=1 Tax=Clostridium sp. TaxID=1506 RepID=UPI0029079C41|nr:riboflavin biosynthesis protein RibF [Clostridium sp.]MDU7338949.1 riboflavin biosynthesis protein RibF [Clostridium sp.]
MRLQVFHDLKQIAPSESAVAMGAFDGVHLGHRRVISCVTFTARKLVPTVFTFDASPQELLKGEGDLRLTSCESKMRVLEGLGVRRVYMPRFEEVRLLSPHDFVEKILHHTLRAKEVSCGFNFHFGCGGTAGSNELREICAEFGIEVSVVPALTVDGEPVSSTRIRKALLLGDATEAARLLGRFYSIDFPVAHGRQLGRQLGAPTINQPFPPGFLAPRFGVYTSVVTVNGKRYAGVTNIGIRPTVGSDGVLAETMIDGFSGDLYGRRVPVELVCFLRPEQKFDNLDQLREAILRDAQTARSLAAPYLQTQEAMI